MDTNEIKRGMKLRDNDPRMTGRMMTVTQVCTTGVFAVDATKRERFYAASRIFPMDKIRRSGVTILPQ